MRRTARRKLEILTARVDDYLWHTGRELQEAQIELIRWSWPRGLRGELREIDTLTRKMERYVRNAQIATLKGEASADILLDDALGSLAQLTEVAEAMTRRLDKLLCRDKT